MKNNSQKKGEIIGLVLKLWTCLISISTLRKEMPNDFQICDF